MSAIAELWDACGYKKLNTGRGEVWGIGSEALRMYLQVLRRKIANGEPIISFEIQGRTVPPEFWGVRPLTHAELTLCLDTMFEFVEEYPTPCYVDGVEVPFEELLGEVIDCENPLLVKILPLPCQLVPQGTGSTSSIVP